MKQRYPLTYVTGSARRIAAIFSIICMASFCPAKLFGQAPTISSFSPLSGPVGATITISGTNFDPTSAADIVFFGSIQATVTSASTTSLSVTVPFNAAFSPISVLNTGTGLVAGSGTSFLPTYTPNLTSLSPAGFAVNTMPSATHPFCATEGDIDGDGKPDLLVGTLANNSLAVYRNTGSAGSITFATSIVFPVGHTPAGVTVGDIDGDGKPDVVITTQNQGVLIVLRNTSTVGNISFATAIVYNLPNSILPAIAVINDFDGDGKPDLAISDVHNNGVVIMHNTGSPGNIVLTMLPEFSTGPASFMMAAGDIDGDGKPDIAVINSFSILTNNISILHNTSTPGTVSFGPAIQLSPGIGQNGIAMSDIDGDGKPDMVLSNGGSAGGAVILLNTSTPGNISFGVPAKFTAGTTCFSVSVADIDGDGKPDVAISNNGSNTVSLLRNTSTIGNVSFAAKVDLTTGTGPRQVIVADLDGDGRPDIMNTNYDGANLSIFRNNQVYLTGLTVSKGKLLPAFNSTKTIIYSDTLLYADSVLSVTPTASAVGATITVNGTTVASGTASTGVHLAVGPNAITITPAITGTQTIYTIKAIRGPSPAANLASLTLSNGTLSPVFKGFTYTYAANVANTITSITVTPTRNSAAATIKVNGTKVASGSVSAAIPLVIGSNTITIAVDAHDGTTATYNLTVTRLVATGPVITAFSPAKGPIGTTVNITGTGFNATAASNVVFFGSTRATVTIGSATSLTVTAPAGDLYSPISVVNTGNGLSDYSANFFTPTFTPNKSDINIEDFAAKAFTAKTGNGPEFIATTDLDGDGKPDLVTVSFNTGGVSVLRNVTAVPGGRRFAERKIFRTGGAPTAIAVGDIDGDGKPDLVVANQGDNTISVLLNTSTTGSISFAPKVNLAVGYRPCAVAISDVDGDGKGDIVATDQRNATIVILPNTSTPGTVSFAAKKLITVGRAQFTVAMNDLDGDGKPDMVTGTLSNYIVVLRNTSIPGLISFGAPQNITTGSFSVVAIGDIDSDGKPDLAVANSQSNTMSVLLNTSTTGTINFAPKVDFATGDRPISIAIGDINGDGKPDIAVANSNSATTPLNIWQNNSSPGSINLAPALKLATGQYPSSVVVCDMNGDGKPDLVTSKIGDNTVSVINNLSKLPARLSNLSVDAGTLTPVFDSTHTAYADTVDNDAASINITPTAAGAGYAIHVNGYLFISGTAKSINLPDVGRQDTITIKVTAPGKELVTYTIIVLRVSRNANLTELYISSGTLIPAFDPRVTFYTDTVTTRTKFLQVRPVAHNDATITVNGVLQQPGNPAASIALKYGDDNIIRINVTAQDGKSVKYYHIHVHHPYISQNTQLDSLTLSSGTLSPAFDKNHNNYTATVDNATTSIQVTPVSHNEHQTLKINGVPVASGSTSPVIPLAVGNTEIDVAVSAQKPNVGNTYSIIVTRAAPSGMDFSAAHKAFAVTIYPNPSVSAFSLKINNGDTNSSTTVTIRDLQGKILYQQKGSVNDVYTFGQNFAIGIYIAEITNGKFDKQVKLIKAVQ